MGKPERTVLAIGAGVLALVLIAVVVVLAAGSSEPQDFPPGSPEAALQQYVETLRTGDREAALALLSASARERVKDDDYFPSPYCGGTDDRRVRITDTVLTGDRAIITVTVQEASSSIFDFDQYEYTQTVPMKLEDGQWRVDEPYVCF
ncbi:MAG: hypothetical protein DCC58_14940 [Chloroflexi bacterium]|nr:MAG: hypothetical protein DCC58_14940 [Chloroflexota bacterium]